MREKLGERRGRGRKKGKARAGPRRESSSRRGDKG